MFDKSLVEDIREAGLGDLITPVVWGYKVDVTAEGYFPANLFKRLSRVSDVEDYFMSTRRSVLHSYRLAPISRFSPNSTSQALSKVL